MEHLALVVRVALVRHHQLAALASPMRAVVVVVIKMAQLMALAVLVVAVEVVIQQ